ncbi:thioredoxin-like domain-containing protein [Obelidium mucronatum]|nr:thioredoxin-like domain-containing protein [Obelidium mucronatum]
MIAASKASLLPLVSLFALLALQVSAAGKCSAKQHDVEEVQILKDASFYRSWAKRKGSEEDPLVSFVMFCTPTKKECKEPKKEFEKMAVKLVEKGIEFGSVDCAAEKEICQDAKAYTTRLPLFKSYRNGQMSKYTGELTSERMSKYIIRQIKGPIREVKNTSKHIEEFKASEDFTVLGLFRDASSPSYKEYLRAAKDLQVDYTFGYAFGAEEEHIVAHSVSNEFETMFDSDSVGSSSSSSTQQEPNTTTSPDDDDENEEIAKFTKDDITGFIKTASLPLVADLDADNFKIYTDMKLPIGFTFLHSAEDREKMIEILTPLAKLYRGYLNFLLIDGAKFEGLEDSMSNDGTSDKKRSKKGRPQFVINEFEPEYHNYPLTTDADLLSEEGEVALAGFIESFILGETKPMIISEDIPESNDQDIKVVVGHSFEEIVMDTKKDVLLMFMKSEMDYKERFERVYTKIAKVLQSQTDNIVVAKMNMKHNRLPKGVDLKVDVVPKLMLVKSTTAGKGVGRGDSKEGVDYALNKNALLLSKVIEFLENNSNYAADLKDLDHDEL